jgi:hypothetical protein
MKRILINFLMAVGITGPFVAHVAAQNNPAVAEIPFAFVANHVQLPAGTYRVSEASQISRGVFTLANSQGSIFVNMGSNEKGNPAKPSLTFTCYGKECVLAKITPPNSSTAYSVGSGYVERSLSHSLGMASIISIKLSH